MPDWEKIVPQFLHRSYSTISSVSGFLTLAQSKDIEKNIRYTGKAEKGIHTFEMVLTELSLLTRDFEIDNDFFDLSFLLKSILEEYDKIALSEDIDFFNENWTRFHGDIDKIKVFINLALRLVTSNKRPDDIPLINIDNGYITIERKPFQDKTIFQLIGSWGYEDELLVVLAEKLDWKITSEYENEIEKIFINPR